MPNTYNLPNGEILLENDVVSLRNYRGQTWIAHRGWYTYRGQQFNGWYFESIPDGSVIPLTDSDLVGLIIESTGSSTQPSTPLEPPQSVPTTPLEPPISIPSTLLQPPSSIPSIPLQPPISVPSTPLQPPIQNGGSYPNQPPATGPNRPPYNVHPNHPPVMGDGSCNYPGHNPSTPPTPSVPPNYVPDHNHDCIHPSHRPNDGNHNHHDKDKFTEQDKIELMQSFITVNTLKDRDRLVNRYAWLPHGKIVKVNVADDGTTKFYKWDQIAEKWEIENFGVDLSNVATKTELEGYATKADLENLATKDDIANFATKDELTTTITEVVEVRVPQIVDTKVDETVAEVVDTKIDETLADKIDEKVEESVDKKIEQTFSWGSID